MMDADLAAKMQVRRGPAQQSSIAKYERGEWWRCLDK